MDHRSEVALIERVLAHLAAKTTDVVDAQSSCPVAAYLDPARLERERAALFRSLPLCAGPSHLVRTAGDFFTADLDGVPVLVSRDHEGRLGAFLNVCRHRGTRVVQEPCGGDRRSFVCPYHAWTYGIDGRLLGIPQQRGFPQVDRGQRGLVRLPVAEAHGLIFVVPTPTTTTIELDEFLAPVADDLAGLAIADHVSYDVRTIRRRFNWKMSFDIFLEAYHIRHAHAATIWPLFFDNLGLFDGLGRHQRNIFPKRTIAGLAEVDPESWSLRPVANILYYLFPNTILLVEPDHMAMFTVFPEGTDEARLESRLLIPAAPESPRAAAHWDKNAAILRGAIDEDFAAGESIQAGLRSGANEALTFGRYEQALGRFHAAIDQALADAETRSL